MGPTRLEAGRLATDGSGHAGPRRAGVHPLPASRPSIPPIRPVARTARLARLDRERIGARSIWARLALIIVALATVLSPGVGTHPAAAGTGDDERLFISLINQTRASAGLGPLTVHSELTAAARSWSATMATNDHLVHASNVASGVSAPWSVLGENVGVHTAHDVHALHQAFVASPSHYRNIVDPRYQYIGVGVVIGDDGRIWTTHRFMATETAEAPTSEVPTTSPPTTAPPTTSRSTSSPATSTPATTDRSTADRADSQSQPSSSTTRPTVPPTSSATSASNSNSSPTSTPPTPDPASSPDSTSSPDPSGTLTAPPSAAGTGEAGARAAGQPAGPGPEDVETVEELLLDLIASGL